MDERERNGQMVDAVAKGNLKSIRRLIEDGLNPTYLYAYEYSAASGRYDGRAVRLRLSDILNDTNELRSDDKGLDRILALFIELGMDVAAVLDQAAATDATRSSSAAPGKRSAWGPSLKLMERARDREARLRAFEIALQNGLRPNEDVSEWLFAELPQVCGRDRSQFAIQVLDLLHKYLGSSLQDDFWRVGERGAETVADVLDRSISPGNPRNAVERAQFAQVDAVWENCSLLSRRINRYLMQGN